MHTQTPAVSVAAIERTAFPSQATALTPLNTGGPGARRCVAAVCNFWGVLSPKSVGPIFHPSKEEPAPCVSAFPPPAKRFFFAVDLNHCYTNSSPHHTQPRIHPLIAHIKIIKKRRKKDRKTNCNSRRKIFKWPPAQRSNGRCLRIQPILAVPFLPRWVGQCVCVCERGG